MRKRVWQKKYTSRDGMLTQVCGWIERRLKVQSGHLAVSPIATGMDAARLKGEHNLTISLASHRMG